MNSLKWFSSHPSSSISSSPPIFLAFPQKILLHTTYVFVSKSQEISRSISSAISTTVLPTSHLRSVVTKSWILKLSQLFFMNLLYLFWWLQWFHIIQDLYAFFNATIIIRKQFFQYGYWFLLELDCTHNIRNLKVKITQSSIINSRVQVVFGKHF